MLDTDLNLDTVTGLRASLRTGDTMMLARLWCSGWGTGWHGMWMDWLCSGPSMEPTIQNSDVVFAENLSRHFYGIQRGDIVIAKSPSDPKSNICKRVIGLEGDKILTNSPSDFFKSRSYVPTGHVWLEGDNLQNSTDSRYYGPIPYGLIRGRIFFKNFPCLINFHELLYTFLHCSCWHICTLFIWMILPIKNRGMVTLFSSQRKKKPPNER
ncbi:inner mitochondrial membrane peptidase subunit 1 [Rhinolophus ferrumequinum]|uniref:Mitochondrial inner membrane protease subunit n=1 Tax=Rhinolophus ferrumequinum TaxID=59479 RepID=A0A7J7W7L5_RHIFE|nr:inner mitochondrial membrane peptidase subunit 1 [Rhinolophus ferrumequinum]